MKVFVAGGTGVIGRALLPQLIHAGHEVVAISRTASGRNALRAQGAEGIQ